MSKENFGHFNQAIFVVKPGVQHRSLGEYPLPVVIESLLKATPLSMLRKQQTQLDESGVRRIYPILSEPSEYGEAWKGAVVDFMTSAPITAYLMEGSDAEGICKTIRTALRDNLTDKSTETGRVVQNIAHTSDTVDFDDTYATVFPHE